MLGSTSEMQKSGDRSNVAGEVFMEKDRIEFTLEPMRFWFVEKKRGGIPRKRKYNQGQGRGNDCGHLERHQDVPYWKAAHIGEWWRINLRSLLKIIFKSSE